MRNKDRNIYDQIRQAKQKRKLLAILLDPDKIVWENLDHLILKNRNHRLPIFSLAEASETNIIDELIIRLKHKVKINGTFPGNPSQISQEADAILFLS
jgi:putative glycerol-1-phosphate prenyltransferase